MKITSYDPEFSLNLSGTGGVIANNYSSTSLGSNTPLPNSGGGSVGSGPQAAPWDHVHPDSGASAFGSNATRVSSVSSAGASNSNSRADHVHDGIATITASGSNTLNRGTFNLRAGTGIALALSNTDGGGGFDTVTIQNVAASGGGGGGVTSISKSGSSALTGAVTLSGGTGITLTQSGQDISIAASGSNSLYPFDNVTLHGTYGDHFDAATIDYGQWTARAISSNWLYTADSHWRHAPYLGVDFGMLQPWTPTDEAEFRMAASPFVGNVGQFGFGLAVLNSSGTGVWLGFRETSRMGIHAVTTYVIADEPSSNFGGGYASVPGYWYLGEGRKVWYSLIKESGLYRFRYSMDGATWMQETANIAYEPSSFTPSQIGFLGGIVNGLPVLSYPVDWFNVHSEKSYGNNLMITPTSGTVTASAAATTGGTPAAVIDGSISDSWYVVGTTTTIWWNAAFSVAQTMNRLRMRVRGDAWGSGFVQFSDGSEVPFFGPASGWVNLQFPTKTTTSVKVWCLRSGQGSNPGFYEIQAYLAS